MKIATVVGARPQFVKLAPLAAMLDGPAAGHTVIHTGQHWDACMSAVFFDELGIRPPDVNLGVGGTSDLAQVSHMMLGLEPVLAGLRPDVVVVLGDTNSTIAGALAAAKLHLPLAHVEAGLRSGDRRMPEEINRVVTDHVSDLLFAPTDGAVANLRSEGIGAERVVLTGDVMYDAHLMFRRRIDAGQVLGRFNLREHDYVLATLHRSQNTDDPDRLRIIIGALRSLAADISVVLPVHPRTRKALDGCGLMPPSDCGLQIVDPVGYLEMIALEEQAKLVASDSGGVQKEAFFCRVPCATIRETTEWTELVDLGWNLLCPPRSVDELLLGLRSAMSMRGADASPYGDGHAASRIAAELKRIARA